jgi:hypothetical protein
MAVGRSVFDLFRDGVSAGGFVGVTINAAHATLPDGLGGFLVPKKDLVATLQLLLQEQRLKVSHSLERAPTLVVELQQFKLKTVTLKPEETIEWRERPHDDLVLAVAIGAWWANRLGLDFFFKVI